MTTSLLLSSSSSSSSPLSTYHRQRPMNNNNKRNKTNNIRKAGKAGGFALCFILFFQCFNIANAAFQVTVGPKEEECFFVSYPHGPSMLFGNYDQIDGLSSSPLSLVVMDVEKERVMFRSKRGSKEGTFRVNLKQGQKASICIQNGINAPGRRPNANEDDNMDRVVGFQFMIEPRNEAVELQVQNARLIQSTRDLTRELNTLRSHHDYMRAREAMHREVVEKTFSGLLWWVIAEAITLVLVAAGQVMYFRRFLEKRRYI